MQQPALSVLQASRTGKTQRVWSLDSSLPKFSGCFAARIFWILLCVRSPRRPPFAQNDWPHGNKSQHPRTSCHSERAGAPSLRSKGGKQCVGSETLFSEESLTPPTLRKGAKDGAPRHLPALSKISARTRSHSEERRDEESRRCQLHKCSHHLLDSSLRALARATALRSE